MASVVSPGEQISSYRATQKWSADEEQIVHKYTGGGPFHRIGCKGRPPGSCVSSCRYAFFRKFAHPYIRPTETTSETKQTKPKKSEILNAAAMLRRGAQLLPHIAKPLAQALSSAPCSALHLWLRHGSRSRHSGSEKWRSHGFWNQQHHRQQHEEGFKHTVFVTGSAVAVITAASHLLVPSEAACNAEVSATDVATLDSGTGQAAPLRATPDLYSGMTIDQVSSAACISSCAVSVCLDSSVPFKDLMLTKSRAGPFAT